MQAAERRQRILNTLKTEQGPVSAARLAAELSVSRQIIVGDVALLRAAGENISATPRGYVVSADAAEAAVVRRIACCHSAQQMVEELNAVVDNGCTVLDVIVEHPVYGEITGPLRLSSRYDVQRFAEKVNASEAQPLSALTEGIHLHTLQCPDTAAFERVCCCLKQLGILMEE